LENSDFFLVITRHKELLVHLISMTYEHFGMYLEDLLVAGVATRIHKTPRTARLTGFNFLSAEKADLMVVLSD